MIYENVLNRLVLADIREKAQYAEYDRDRLVAQITRLKNKENRSRLSSYEQELKSIENQREILSKFVMLNGWTEVKTYADDGYSGGNFQRIVFPSLGCRFVSVMDCLDTEGDNTDMLHFRSLMNDYHLKDLSNKIKSVRYAKMKSGQFLSAYAPYGYRKSEDDKHKLIIGEYAAAVVRRAFSMRRDGAEA